MENAQFLLLFNTSITSQHLQIHPTALPVRREYSNTSRHSYTNTTGTPNSTSCTDLRKVILGVPDVMTSRQCTTCSNYTCEAVLFNKNGSNQLYKDIEAWMEQNISNKSAAISEEDEKMIKKTTNCVSYVVNAGYHTRPVSEEEARFPIAYNILIHKDIEQMESLLKVIYRPQNTYCIHVDGKSPKSLHNSVHSLAKCLDNVFVASKLENITYAGFSRLQADINCMSDQLKHQVQWKYLINIASQAFPLKTNAEIVKILQIYNGSNDIEGQYFDSRMKDHRIDHEWVEKDGHVVLTGHKNADPPHGIRLAKGSAYGTFSRGFVEFLLNNTMARDLLEWSRHTYSPDEHYWATLHHTYTNPHLHTPGGYSGKCHIHIKRLVTNAINGKFQVAFGYPKPITLYMCHRSGI